MVLVTFFTKMFPSIGQSGEPLNSPWVSPVTQKSDHTISPYLSAASKNASGGVTPPPQIRTRLTLALRHKCSSRSNLAESRFTIISGTHAPPTKCTFLPFTKKSRRKAPLTLVVLDVVVR